MTRSTRLFAPATRLAAMTSKRDRYVDFLRVISIAVVVVGHWLMAVVSYRGGTFSGHNALEIISGLWIATWVLQVMPLFFFVGGFSNFVGWRSAQGKGHSYQDFVRSRVERLMRPTLVFIGIWLVGASALYSMAHIDAQRLSLVLALVAKPLWFLAVYVLVVTLAPAMARLHLSYGIRVPVVLGLGAVAVDFCRLAFDLEMVGYLNFAFVWLTAHQLGFFYADGSLLRLSGKVFAGIATLSLVALVVLTTVGPYSPFMVGGAAVKASNNSPPSVCLIALSLWLIALAMLLRTRLSEWLQSQRVWTGVIVLGSRIMTVFLWHLTALFIGAFVLYRAGFPQPPAGTSDWWLLRPVWIVALIPVLIPFVAVLGRFEKPTGSATAPARPRRAMPGVALLVLGLAGLAEFGFDMTSSVGVGPTPLMSALCAGAGYVLVHSRRAEKEMWR
ncbi:MAG: acyltransferase [Actinomycetota bacterium]|nr:acyltransferase [Actinomycetota bacterium]